MKFLPTLSIILSKVSHLKVIWKKWDIRTFLIASFTFQLMLIISAPFRKRTSNLISRVTLWLSYLLADWVAAQAIGLITRATEPGGCQSVSDAQGYLFAFWAQFLLIHLGGPDTITALALEDNELWLRTGLHLGTQAFATLGVLFRATRLSGLWAATVLMFLAGVVKYLERVMSLFHGRLLDLDDDPKEYAQQLHINHRAGEELTNIEMVRDAYNLFHCFKRLYTERELGYAVRRSTKEYFMRRSPEEAYKLLEIQLNFMYEAMYTKMVVIHRGAWKILRHLVLLLQVSGLVIWFLAEKRGYVDYDIRITYTLVVGAIAVDMLSFLRIHFSDWNIARLDEKKCWHRGFIPFYIYNIILAARTAGTKRRMSEEDDTKKKTVEAYASILWSWSRRVFLGRWSESIHQFEDELPISDNMQKVMRFFKVEIYIFRHLGVRKTRVSSEIWEFVFDEVMVSNHKSESPNSKTYELSNGNEIDIGGLFELAFPTNTLDQQYLKVLILKWRSFTPVWSIHSRHHYISQTLCDYLLYLATFQPNMMFAAAGKEKLFKFLDIMYGRQKRQKKDEQQLEEEQHPDGLEEGEDKDQILDPDDVCAEINCTDEEKKRLSNELLARGWVKLLCHAAIRCSPREHAESLKEGGELLSFVWLLMLHLNVTKV